MCGAFQEPILKFNPLIVDLPGLRKGMGAGGVSRRRGAKGRGEPKLPSRFVAAPRTELELNVEGKFKLTRSAVVALTAAATLTTD